MEGRECGEQCWWEGVLPPSSMLAGGLGVPQHPHMPHAAALHPGTGVWVWSSSHAQSNRVECFMSFAVPISPPPPPPSEKPLLPPHPGVPQPQPSGC